MRSSQHDRSTVADAEAWLAFTKRADELIVKIEDAFADVRLGDGTGLREAGGLDDYATGSDLRLLRNLDEKADWRRIDEDTLARCHAAPSFLDAKGMLFHLPAFLCAELRGNEIVDVFSRLVYDTLTDRTFRSLLTAHQRVVIIGVLWLLADPPACWYDRNDIDRAISRYQEG